MPGALRPEHDALHAAGVEQLAAGAEERRQVRDDRRRVRLAEQERRLLLWRLVAAAERSRHRVCEERVQRRGRERAVLRRRPMRVFPVNASMRWCRQMPCRSWADSNDRSPGALASRPTHFGESSKSARNSPSCRPDGIISPVRGSGIDVEQDGDFLALRLVQRGEQVGDRKRSLGQVGRDRVGADEVAAAAVGEAARDHEHEQRIRLARRVSAAA